MAYTPTHPINLPLADFTDLRFHLMMNRPGVEPDAFVTELVQHWLKLDAERIELRKNGPSMRGFQWKNLFLPEGTCLRTSYHHSVEFAKVVGDHIHADDDGEALTPSLFANRYAKGRNAWRLIWLRFPGEAGWVRADDYRARIDGAKS
jgi:hypothetical protein